MSSEPQSSHTGPGSGETRPAYFVMETFRLRFDSWEDRLRLDATDKAEQFQCIWLTQRLANKLIATLAKDLDREVKAPAQAPRGAEAVSVSKSQQNSNSAHDARLTAALHEMAQQRIRTERVQSRLDINRSPVDDSRPASLAADSACWLCTAITLGRQSGGVLITFTGRGNHGAQFFMSYRNARRVLDSLAKHYRRGSWSLQAFPGWVRKGFESEVRETQSRLN